MMSRPQLPTLDEIGATVQCWRIRGENDREYSHRLAVHLQERIIDLENLLTACPAIKVKPNLKEHAHDGSP